MKKDIIWKSILSFVLVGGCLLPAQVQAKETSEENEKIETVYVIGDACGKTQKVIVSDWLKNTTKADTLADVSHLHDIVNVKGKETFQKTKDNLIWDAKGKDIYYQGTADTSPVSVSVSYELNGKTITPEEMGGKSGHIAIHVQYENNSEVNHKKVPLLMLSGTFLEEEYCSNVSVDQGRVIHDGSRYLIVGFGLSGTEALPQIVSDHFTIEADVKDCHTNEMITYASSHVADDLALTTKQDADTLFSSLSQLKSVALQLSNGSGALLEGVTQLQNRSMLLADGMTSIDDGASQLQNGLSNVKGGLYETVKGSEEMSKALTQVSEGIDQLAMSREQLLQGVNALANGMESGGQALSQSISYDEAVVAYLQSLKQQLPEDEQAQLSQLIQAANASVQYQRGVQSSLLDQQSTGTMRNGVSRLQEALGDSENSIGESLSKLQAAMNMTAEKEGKSGILEGMKQLSFALSQMYDGTSSLYDGAVQLTRGTGLMSQSKETLITGINRLYTGASALENGMSSFYDEGIKQLVDVYGSQFQSMVQEVMELVDTGRAYENYSSLSADMKGSVKFVIKTEGIA